MKRPANRTLGILVGGVLVAALAVVLVVTLLPDQGSTPSKKTATPTATTQLTWLMYATHHLPLSRGELDEHVAPGFLSAVGGQSQFQGFLVNLGPLTLKNTRPAAAPGNASAVTETVDASGTTTKYTTELAVSDSGLIDSVDVEPLLATPTSWAAVDRRLRTLAPDVSFASERIGPHGSCTLVHGLHAGTPRPLGSAFKLYVLGALAKDVADHHAQWEQQLAIRSAWKSSGGLASRAAGTKLALRYYADQMISTSDNTAADHLLHFLGRAAVERQLRLFGNAHAQLDTPFLSTRELFTLKGYHYPRLANHYLAASRAERARILEQTARVPLSALVEHSEPHDVTSIEWFASPTDICHAFSGLLQQDENNRLKPVGQALSMTDGSLLLNPVRYPMTWFKGGSEPGVLTENYLVRATDGTVLVSSLMLADPHQILGDQAVPAALAIIRGSVALADAG